MKNREHTQVEKGKVFLSIACTVILLLGFAVVTYALVRISVSVDDHVFTTGKVNININDGVPVITEEEFLFEPGMTVIKDFFVENEGTVAVYYRLYLENVEGELVDKVVVTVKEGNTVLYQGNALDMTKEAVMSPEDALEAGEIRWLSMTLHYPSTEGNEGESSYLYFDVRADAVQAKNNPDKVFE